VSALTLQHVSKSFPAVGRAGAPAPALVDIDLAVNESEFMVVVGPSGCGKSTLLRLVSGILAPTDGDVSFGAGGKSAPSIGMVFQSPVLVPWRTVLKNVLFPLRLTGRSARAHEGRARELIELVGLAGFEHYYPWQLSGGMQHRAALARALITSPDLLLMDEPFAALDVLTREQMAVELARIWAATRTTVLFITHSIEEAVFLADRVVVMSPRPGRIIRNVPVEYPRPRTWDMLTDPDIARLVADVRQELTARPADSAPMSTGA
jgi:NitT/TauT family transport system ATP-binding protein